MIEDDEPNLVTSGKSERIVVHGYPFSIDIFRLEDGTTWTLEVIDHQNTSYAWDEQFGSSLFGVLSSSAFEVFHPPAFDVL